MHWTDNNRTKLFWRTPKSKILSNNLDTKYQLNIWTFLSLFHQWHGFFLFSSCLKVSKCIACFVPLLVYLLVILPTALLFYAKIWKKQLCNLQNLHLRKTNNSREIVRMSFILIHCYFCNYLWLSNFKIFILLITQKLKKMKLLLFLT